MRPGEVELRSRRREPAIGAADHSPATSPSPSSSNRTTAAVSTPNRSATSRETTSATAADVGTRGDELGHPLQGILLGAQSQRLVPRLRPRSDVLGEADVDRRTRRSRCERPGRRRGGVRPSRRGRCGTRAPRCGSRCPRTRSTRRSRARGRRGARWPPSHARATRRWSAPSASSSGSRSRPGDRPPCTARPPWATRRWRPRALPPSAGRTARSRSATLAAARPCRLDRR